MLFKTIAVIACAAAAVAQETRSSVLFFTRAPNPVTDGQPQALLWSTNDTSSPVTITLRQGNPAALTTIKTLTTTGGSGQYIWTPEATLPDGSDYALEISQNGQVNYFGPFAVQGASFSSTASGSTTAGATSTLVAGVLPSNGTMTTGPTGVGSAASMGTGTTMMRNMTMSSATLSSSSTSRSSGAGFQTMSSTTSSGWAVETAHLNGALALAIGAAAVALI